MPRISSIWPGVYILGILMFFSLAGLGQKEYFITSDDQTKLFVREFGVGKPIILSAGGPGLNADYLQPVWEKLS